MKKDKLMYMMLLCIVSMMLIACSPKIKDTIDWKHKEVSEADKSDVNQGDINEYYAGTYYDEEGKLICCYTGKLEKVKAYIQIPVSEFRKVNYNLKQLNDTYETYSDQLGKYGIVSAGLSCSDNAIIVTLEDFDQIEEIKENIQSEAVVFQLKDPNMETKFTKKLTSLKEYKDVNNKRSNIYINSY